MHPVGLSGGHKGEEHSEQLSRNHLRCDSMCQGKSQFKRTNSIFFEELLVILKFRVQENSGCSTVTEILATDHQSRTTPPPPSSPTELYSSHLCSFFSSPLFWKQEIFGGKVRSEQWRVSGSLPLCKVRERFHRLRLPCTDWGCPAQIEVALHQLRLPWTVWRKTSHFPS